MFFPLLFSQRTCQTTNIPSRTMKTMSKVQSEHTQSLHLTRTLGNFSHA